MWSVGNGSSVNVAILSSKSVLLESSMNSLQVQVIVPAFMSKFIQFEFCFFFFTGTFKWYYWLWLLGLIICNNCVKWQAYSCMCLWNIRLLSQFVLQSNDSHSLESQNLLAGLWHYVILSLSQVTGVLMHPQLLTVPKTRLASWAFNHSKTSQSKFAGHELVEFKQHCSYFVLFVMVVLYLKLAICN